MGVSTVNVVFAAVYCTVGAGTEVGISTLFAAVCCTVEAVTKAEAGVSYAYAEGVSTQVKRMVIVKTVSESKTQLGAR